jgi:peptidoglycan-N-acetylmuramic acid deacetylase
MNTKVFVRLLAVALIGALLILGGCNRDLKESLPEPVQSVIPPVSSIPMPPEISEPHFGSSAVSDLPALAMSADFLQIGALDNAPVQWGPGTAKDALGRSTACIDLQNKYEKYNAWFIGPPDERTITLSFDQGYENGYTAPILDALKEKGVTAIFFLTGHYVRSQPELVGRMIDEGHILGNHSDSHKVYCRELSIEESFEDAKYMQDYLREHFDYEMRLFRFPSGEFSEQSLSLMQQMGYKSVFWSFAYADWDVNNQPEPEAALDRITAYLHPGEILLLHSVSATNAQILPELIDVMRAQGYAVAPLDILLA